MKRRSWGFTLIELLVVLFIIGIIATMAVIAIGDGIRHRKINNTAEELQLIMTYAGEEAILQSAVLGFVLRSNGYEFYRYIPQLQPSSESPWQRMKNDRILGLRKLPSYIQLNLVVDKKRVAATNKTKNVEPQLIISNSGTITPFYLNIGEVDENPRFRLRGDASGEYKLIQLDEEDS